ncbi:MAG: cysteine--tRNA ligase [Candidatus Glassbacteria bacterium]|nr:cysteine--tRNA ligase [Candidatus Glassbacteria bacterium]
MQEFYLYNTLSRSKEPLDPLEPGHVRFYGCGPTVYDYAHIGNYRAYVVMDLLRRCLGLNGFKVTQVVNLTDVDDKTINGAANAGKPLAEYTEPYIEAFFEDLDALRIERAEHYPRATGHIREIIELIGRLERNGLTYRSGDSVYFRIADFKGYGRLSRLDTSGIKAGARVDVDSYDKEDLRDFVLWKGRKDENVGWESPFGCGRPGWHVECSAMSMKYLGETLDIHCGGVDLIFPHHENEIAQSEGATGKPFVRCWLHWEHLMVEGRKMSKSLGNYYTFRDLLEKGHKPTAIRYILLSTHYRSQLNFTFDALAAAASAVERLRDFKRRLENYRPAAAAQGEPLTWCADRFRQALADDLSISTALASLFDFVREVNSLIDAGSLSESSRSRALEELALCDRVLDVLAPDGRDEIDRVEYVEKLVEERKRARKARDFARADEIRDELAAMGIALEDSPEGTHWKKKT